MKNRQSIFFENWLQIIGGEEMIVKNAELVKVCGVTSKLPENTMPEIAFAGKSNVGKSSLINGLVNRKALARTSSQPGKTQTINFYEINQELYFVDLPGYGYAKVSKEIKAKWGKLIEKYLYNSKQLKVVFFLVDIRHEPSGNDVDMYEWILASGGAIIIATKLDKIKRSQVQKNIKIIKKNWVQRSLRLFHFRHRQSRGRKKY